MTRGPGFSQIMAWHHVTDETTTAPRFQPKPRLNRQGFMVEGMSNIPTGGTVEATHSIWRCGSCRALAVTEVGTRMFGPCGKCGTGT